LPAHDLLESRTVAAIGAIQSALLTDAKQRLKCSNGFGNLIASFLQAIRR